MGFQKGEVTGQHLNGALLHDGGILVGQVVRVHAAVRELLEKTAKVQNLFKDGIQGCTQATAHGFTTNHTCLIGCKGVCMVGILGYPQKDGRGYVTVMGETQGAQQQHQGNRWTHALCRDHDLRLRRFSLYVHAFPTFGRDVLNHVGNRQFAHLGLDA